MSTCDCRRSVALLTEVIDSQYFPVIATSLDNRYLSSLAHKKYLAVGGHWRSIATIQGISTLRRSATLLKSDLADVALQAHLVDSGMLQRGFNHCFTVATGPRGMNLIFGPTADAPEKAKRRESMPIALPTGHFDERSQRLLVQTLEQSGVTTAGEFHQRKGRLIPVKPNKGVEEPDKRLRWNSNL